MTKDKVAYEVSYLEDGIYSKEKSTMIFAKSKEDAYSKFLKEYGYVWSAWVSKKICKNGKSIEFNTFAGKPY